MKAALKAALVVSALALLPTGAAAWDSNFTGFNFRTFNFKNYDFKGNDTGGIISWSCEAEAMAMRIAGDHCAEYGKYPRITSVHRHYGDYIAFSCLWTPYIARFQMPRTPTRSVCHAPRVRPHGSVLVTKN